MKTRFQVLCNLVYTLQLVQMRVNHRWLSARSTKLLDKAGAAGCTTILQPETGAADKNQPPSKPQGSSCAKQTLTSTTRKKHHQKH